MQNEWKYAPWEPFHLFWGVFFSIVWSTSMARRLRCNPVSFTGFCPVQLVKLRILVHSRQHFHAGKATPEFTLAIPKKWLISETSLRVLSSVTHKFDVLRCLNIDFCRIHSIGSLFYCEQKLCSWHLVTTSMVIALRTLTNDYFLLSSPFAVYRWKNPQYKFLLLLDRQWPMYAVLALSFSSVRV